MWPAFSQITQLGRVLTVTGGMEGKSKKKYSGITLQNRQISVCCYVVLIIHCCSIYTYCVLFKGSMTEGEVYL